MPRRKQPRIPDAILDQLLARISQMAALGTDHGRPFDECVAAACQGLPRDQSTRRAWMALEALDACRPGFLVITNVVCAARPSR